MIRPDCPPGTIIEHRRVVVGGRWRVRRMSGWGGRDLWVAIDREGWASAFLTHAAAIAYADRLARREDRP